MQLLKQREKERQEIEFQKKKLEAELRVGEFINKFTVHHDSMESQLKTDTVRFLGLLCDFLSSGWVGYIG